MVAAHGSVWGFFAALGKMQIGSTVFLTDAAGLNNQRVGKSLLFQSSRIIFWNLRKMRGHLVDCLD
jgi:hypothetical protein